MTVSIQTTREEGEIKGTFLRVIMSLCCFLQRPVDQLKLGSLLLFEQFCRDAHAFGPCALADQWSKHVQVDLQPIASCKYCVLIDDFLLIFEVTECSCCQKFRFL
jgi:hypothetical protein